MNADRIDVDFSLAIHNRTGKYFIGRDLIDIEDLPLGDVRYWYLASREPPSGLFGKLVGRLQHLHIQGKTVGGLFGVLPRRRSARPLLHLDPFTVPAAVLRRQDAVLCHDIGPLTHPKLFDADVCRIYQSIYDEIARVGPHMIFVSETSRAAFVKRYPAARFASARVIYPALRPAIASVSPAAVPGVQRPFLLTVGSLGNRKNQVSCITAFARSGLAQRGVSYVLCGGPEPGFDLVQKMAALTPGVICLDYVTDAELRWLYQSAQGFVLMSHLEGFGMPVAEAISRGLVPLLSRSSVLHEVAGDAALLANPNNEAEIAAQMVVLAKLSDEERAARSQVLKQSIDRFDPVSIRQSWRDTFAEILSAARQG